MYDIISWVVLVCNGYGKHLLVPNLTGATGKYKAYSLVKCKGFPSFQLYGRYYIRRADLIAWEKKAIETKVKQGSQRIW